MPDRVRQTIFDILGSRFGCPGDLPPLRVADAFAGSGSMGLEALSRGAAHCFFFERDREAFAVLQHNIQTLGADTRATVVSRHAWQAAVADPTGRPFDLIFLDPPYRDSEDGSETGAVRRYLRRLAEHEGNRPLIVLHHSAHVVYRLAENDAWQVDDEREIGSNRVTFFAR